MLKHLAIRDYAIVDHLDLDLEAGMTTITGETGAGKSIMLDALGLCIGDRAEARTVRPGAQRADITATFDIANLPDVQKWLRERDLDHQDNECLLRRTVNAEGRSKSFINGAPATLNDCASLGALLVDIHSQHAHQSLLRAKTQRRLLDSFGNAGELAVEVAEAARIAKTLTQKYAQRTEQTAEATAKRELLQYQVEELEELALTEGEVTTLENEQKLLANAHFLLESAEAATEGCDQQGEHLARLKALLDDDRHPAPAVAEIRELLTSSVIQLKEAHTALQRYTDSIEIDPGRLREVEERLDAIYRLARKHRVAPETLLAHQQVLTEELASLTADDASLEQLSKEIDAAKSHYQERAAQLSQLRQQAAVSLADRVMAHLNELAMGRCQFTVALHPIDTGTLDPGGFEHIEFLISTQPGSSPGTLAKIASGGELSRISLAVHIAVSGRITAPTMIFDEVDVGIGGAVAEVVGTLLRRLAGDVQVICVTHLAQVAAMGHQQLQVSKTELEGTLCTAVNLLTDEERIEEIARMSGGIKLTDSSRAHARDLLSQTQK